MKAGDRVVVLYRDWRGDTVVNLTTVRDAVISEFRVVENARSTGPAWYRDAEEGLTWCRPDPEAVKLLGTAVALGLEAPDEPF